MLNLEEVDDSVLMILYNQEKKKILDFWCKFGENLQEGIGAEPWLENTGQTIEQSVRENTLRDLTKLQTEFFPKKPNLNSNHVWVNINPPKIPKPKYTVTELNDLMIKLCLRYKWCKKHAFVIESHTKNGYRPHIHLMAITNQKKGRIISQLKQFFNLQAESIHVDTCYKGYLYGEHLDYVTGKKKELKDQYRIQDEKEKIDLGLPPYVNNIGESEDILKATTQLSQEQPESSENLGEFLEKKKCYINI